ncbi:MAG: NfeD family protein [Phycisphaerae bacterium]
MHVSALLVCCGLLIGSAPSPGSVAAQPDEQPDAGSGRIGVIIPISNEISDVTTESIKRRVEMAVEKGADVVIFEIDTPGGYVTSALDICKYIKNLEGMKKVAWINKDAYSAGSMIAVACDEIVMARASTLGDCGVILGGPMGPQEVPEQLRAKAESPVLEEFRDSARRNGYDVLLSESMVRKEREVYWIENLETGERRFVDADKKKELVDSGKKTTTVFGVEVPSLGSAKAQWKLVESYTDAVTDAPVKLEQPVVPTTELLTLSQSRAQAFGFSKGIVTGETDLQERYDLVGPIERIEFTWSEIFTRWLTSMPVRGFLMVIVLLGVYVEFNTPGVGVPGLVAVIALGVFLGAPYLTGLANVWEILFVVLGFVLIGVEVFVIPGFGIAGISGILLMIVGLLFTFMPEDPNEWPLYWPQLQPSLDGLKSGIQTLGAAMGLSIVGAVLLSRYLPQLPYLRSIVPENPMPADVVVDDYYDGLARVGDIGVVVGGLHPAGKARFGATLVDVVSEGDMVGADVRVEVVERHGNRIVVRPIQNA